MKNHLLSTQLHPLIQSHKKTTAAINLLLTQRLKKTSTPALSEVRPPNLAPYTNHTNAPSSANVSHDKSNIVSLLPPKRHNTDSDYLLEHMSAESNTTPKTCYMEEQERASNKRKPTEEGTTTASTIADPYATYLEIDGIDSVKKKYSKTTIKSQKNPTYTLK